MPNYEIPSGNIPEDKTIEKEKPEHIPTSEEVLSLFEKLVGEAKYEEVRKLEDEQGLYLWEIKIVQEDGNSIEYAYIRKGNYRDRGLVGGAPPETAIHVTYFDEDGAPSHGTSVYKLIDGKWTKDLSYGPIVDDLRKKDRDKTPVFVFFDHFRHNCYNSFMIIIKKNITTEELKKMLQKMFGNLVKGVVDIEKGIMAVDAELHSDEEALLLENGSKQENLWGINIYPEFFGREDFIEFDSMINLRPSQNNRSRSVDNLEIRKKILEVTSKLISK